MTGSRRGLLLAGVVLSLLMGWPVAVQAAPAAGGPTDSGANSARTSGSQQPKAPVSQRWDWSKAKQVSTDYPAKFVLVSCGSPTFCMAVDEREFYYRWDGRTWSLYNHYGFHTDDPYFSSWVRNLTCSSTRFCASVEESATDVGGPWGDVVFLENGRRRSHYIPDWSAGEVYCASASNCVALAGNSADGWARWDGTSWQVDTSFFATGLTCASATLCLAVTAGAVIRYDGDSWITEEALPLSTVSCTSTALCLALGSDGVTRRFTGAEWVVAATPPVGGQLSCASPTYCTDFGISSYSVYDGHTWSAPVAVPPAPITGLVSCAGARFCAVAQGNQLAQFNGRRWSTVTTVGDDPARLNNVSCATRRSCVGVGTYAAHKFGPSGQLSWTNLDVVTDRASAATDVSCVTTTFCVATTGQWYVSPGGPVIHVFNGSTWKAVVPDSWDELRHPEAVSCATTRFCVTVGGSSFLWWEGQEDSGQTAVFNGVSWRWLESPRFTRVSCVSASFCMATGKVDGRSVSSVFNGTTWSTPAPFVDGTGKAPASVACTATRTCVAIDSDGRAATYRNGRWLTFAPVAAAGPLVAASCHGRSTCLAVSSTGKVVQHLSSRWSRPRHLRGLIDPVDISCPSATACVVVDKTGQAVFGRVR